MLENMFCLWKGFFNNFLKKWMRYKQCICDYVKPFLLSAGLVRFILKKDKMPSFRNIFNKWVEDFQNKNMY